MWELNILIINPSTFIIYKSKIHIVLYFCKTIFNDYYLIINLIIIVKLLLQIVNKVHQHLKKNDQLINNL